MSVAEVVQKGYSIRNVIISTVMPDSDPASPGIVKDRRSRIERGMTTFWTASVQADQIVNKRRRCGIIRDLNSTSVIKFEQIA
jgi:hypothetical protein